MPSFDPEIKHAAGEYADMIARDAYEGDQAQLDVHHAAMQHLASCAAENGLDTRFTQLMTDVFGDACAKGFGDACAKGFGDKEIAATIKILNGSTG